MKKDTSHLVRKKVADKNGKQTTVLVNPNKDNKKSDGKIKLQGFGKEETGDVTIDGKYAGYFVTYKDKEGGYMFYSDKKVKDNSFRFKNLQDFKTKYKDMSGIEKSVESSDDYIEKGIDASFHKRHNKIAQEAYDTELDHIVETLNNTKGKVKDSSKIETAIGIYQGERDRRASEKNEDKFDENEFSEEGGEDKEEPKKEEKKSTHKPRKRVSSIEKKAMEKSKKKDKVEKSWKDEMNESFSKLGDIVEKAL